MFNHFFFQVLFYHIYIYILGCVITYPYSLLMSCFFSAIYIMYIVLLLFRYAQHLLWFSTNSVLFIYIIIYLSYIHYNLSIIYIFNAFQHRAPPPPRFSTPRRCCPAFAIARVCVCVYMFLVCVDLYVYPAP